MVPGPVAHLLLACAAVLGAVAVGVLGCYLYALLEANALRFADRMMMFTLRLTVADRRDEVAAMIGECRDDIEALPPAQILSEISRWPLLAWRISRPLSRGAFRLLRWYATYSVTLNAAVAGAVYIAGMPHRTFTAIDGEPLHGPWSPAFGDRAPLVAFAATLLAAGLLAGSGRHTVLTGRVPWYPQRYWHRRHATGRAIAHLMAGYGLMELAVMTSPRPMTRSLTLAAMFACWITVSENVLVVLVARLARRIWPSRAAEVLADFWGATVRRGLRDRVEAAQI
jgi:hypothetical protein